MSSEDNYMNYFYKSMHKCSVDSLCWNDNKNKE